MVALFSLCFCFPNKVLKAQARIASVRYSLAAWQLSMLFFCFQHIAALSACGGKGGGGGGASSSSAVPLSTLALLPFASCTLGALNHWHLQHAQRYSTNRGCPLPPSAQSNTPHARLHRRDDDRVHSKDSAAALPCWPFPRGGHCMCKRRCLPCGHGWQWAQWRASLQQYALAYQLLSISLTRH